MSRHKFWIKVGDRLPTLDATLIEDDTQTVIDLTAANTVTFSMKKPGEAAAKVDAAAATFVDKVAGQVRYEWGASDTDTPGRYNGEFVVTWSSGEETTFPNHDYIEVIIRPEL